MISEASRRWIAAGSLLAEKPSEQVACPEQCGGYLLVSDEDVPGDSEHFERYMRCPTCGAYNIIYKRRSA